MTNAAIIQFQKKQEAKFMCSACGGDRACDCNAPAVERLAEIVEQRRQARRTYDEKKRQQKQQSSDIRNDLGGTRRMPTRNDAIEEMPSEEEASASYQEALFDQACLLLEQMVGETRQRFFAIMRGKYNGDYL